MNEWLKGFLYFSKSQLRAILLFCVLIVVVFIIPRIYLQFFPPKFEYDISLREALQNALADSSQTENILSGDLVPYADNNENLENKKVLKLFTFNPNEISETEWQQLGFSRRQAEIIETIKAKGFKFYSANDLKKIRVIGEEGFERLKDYVKIPPKTYDSLLIEGKKSTLAYETKQAILLEINTADSIAILALPGIGPYLTYKILKYRNALGGFNSIEQIAETHKLPDSTFQKIKNRIFIAENNLRKININTASADTLMRHPYITYQQAKSIVAFRAANGMYNRVETAQRAGMFSDSIFQKLKPYLVVE